MKPTTILSEEHKHILSVIDALSKERKNLESGKELDKDFFSKAIDFIKNYADKFHHAKEEDILFEELNKNSEEMRCNPIEQMLYEHDLGRGFVKGIEQGLKEDNIVKIIENTRNYIQLLQEHILKEDNILYPMADETLSKPSQDSILELFTRAEKEKFRKGDKEKYLAIAKGFLKRHGK